MKNEKTILLGLLFLEITVGLMMLTDYLREKELHDWLAGYNSRLEGVEAQVNSLKPKETESK